MNHAHFICRKDASGRRENFRDVSPKEGLFECGDWDIAPEEAKRLIGGMIFLHETKATPSDLGGVVEAVLPSPSPFEGRVAFRFRVTPTGRKVQWRGADHAMAWWSGILPRE